MLYFIIQVASLIVGLIVFLIFSILNRVNSMSMMILLCAVLYASIGAFEIMRYKRKKQDYLDSAYQPSLKSRVIFTLSRALLTIPIIYGFYNLTNIVAIVFTQFKYIFTIMFSIMTLYAIVMDILGAKAFKKYTVTKIQDNFIRGKVVTFLYYIEGTVTFLVFFNVLDYLDLFS